LRAEADARVGKPFLELLRAARAWHANLVVVGVSARGEERFLGSTGERVLRKATVPVLLVKREYTAGPKTVLIPVDFSECSRRAAEEGIAVVRGFGGKVIFLHVMDFRYIYPAAYGVEPIYVPPPTPAELEPDWQEFLGGLPLDGVDWEKHTREGRAAPTIAEVASETGADLAAVGTHGRTGLAHALLGSVAEAALRLTPCSVLTVRPEAFRFELP
jgi:nucleotide-binding universal stress UspA family protein